MPLDIEPLFEEDEDSVAARIAADVNQGLVDTDEEYIDTRTGSMFQILTQPLVNEHARIWDAIANDVPAASFPTRAWGDYLDEWASVFGLARIEATKATGVITVTGTDGSIIPAATVFSTLQTDPNVPPIEFKTTGSGAVIGEVTPGEVDIPIEAVLPGVLGNVGDSAITNIVSGVSGVVSVTNAEPTLGGAELESDEQLRARVLLSFQGAGSGNQADYMKWCLSWPGVGRATIVPQYDGPGTVGCVVMDANGGPVSTDIVDDLQYALDPLPGKGAGLAGIDHTVTVLTVTPQEVDVAATVVFETGYSLDGADGSVALRNQIIASIQGYFDQLEAGEDVILAHVSARIFMVTGVYNVTAITLDGAGSNIAITTAPPTIGTLGTVTLT